MLLVPALALLPTLALGCGGGPVSLLSPDPAQPVRERMVPLIAEVPRAWNGRTVTVTLDGNDVTDPLGFVRGRAYSPGISDYLSTLDLDGVPAGRHELILTFTGRDGRRDLARVRLDLAPHPCRLDLEVVDGQGRARPGRVLVVDEADAPVHLWGPGMARLDKRARDRHANVILAPEGHGSATLPCGRYRLVAAGGVRDGVDDQLVDLGEGTPRLRLTVPRLVETPGQVTADLHVHSGRSPDASVPDRLRYASIVAADVEQVLISDHNLLTDPAVALELLGMRDELGFVPGVEARLQGPTPEDGSVPSSVLHLNAYPVAPGEPLPAQEQPDVATLLAAWRDRHARTPVPGYDGPLLLQLNHPRGVRVSEWAQIDRRYGLHLATRTPVGQLPWAIASELLPGGREAYGFDAIEVVNRAEPQLIREVRADWFALLSAGIPVTATGNSDSHAITIEQAGLPVNLVSVPSTGLVPLLDAVRQGHVTVSNGPVVQLQVRGRDGQRVGPGEQVTGSEVMVVARVEAAPWVPVPEVRLVVDGRIEAVLPVPAEGVERGTWRWQVAVDHDSWLLVEAGWPLDATAAPGGAYAIVAPGHRPLGFTNPVWLDADGDGRWGAGGGGRPTVSRLPDPAGGL